MPRAEIGVVIVFDGLDGAYHRVDGGAVHPTA
jgi:hypothetical protein